MTSLYHQTVPVLTKYLRNLSGIIAKGETWVKDGNQTEEELLAFRLHPDMRGLPYQVQSCCNTAKFLLPRLGKLPDTYFPDDETTFAALQHRIATTIDLLQTLPEHAFDGKEAEQVLIETKQMGSFKFTGLGYVRDYTVPYFHFHLTSAYCILRHLGVDVGAFDYLGRDTFVKV
ncbi:hypothetical protein B0A55_00628 [Friedmanniomyces simplex]|uniref:DUF1993 domain-containing protein n=1 Tax=Friedmanniomyces simplex TaxID=329884 RepID=A0A4U0Y6T4_9PEZI|nr:hypothetical protein B0A55_00628 [Friedmanniomyces simplex]